MTLSDNQVPEYIFVAFNQQYDSATKTVRNETLQLTVLKLKINIPFYYFFHYNTLLIRRQTIGWLVKFDANLEIH